MSLDYSATSGSCIGFASPQQPPKNNRTDNSILTSEKQAARQFLSILSPGRKFQDGNGNLNASIISALFPGSPSYQVGGSFNGKMSPYRERSNSAARNEEEYKENLQQTLHGQGYSEEDIQQINKNMILYKSMASIKSYREYMKERMRKARDSSNARARVSTINTKYQPRKSSISTTRGGTKRDLSNTSENNTRRRFVFGSPSNQTSSAFTHSGAGLSNARSQKIIEIEQIINNNQVHSYSKRPVNQHSKHTPNKDSTFERAKDNGGDEQLSTIKTDVSPDRFINQLNENRNTIFHSIEELKKKEQEIVDPMSRESIMNDDLSRDYQTSTFGFNSPPPAIRGNQEEMKLEEIEDPKKKSKGSVRKMSDKITKKPQQQLQQPQPKARSKQNTARQQFLSTKNAEEKKFSKKNSVQGDRPTLKANEKAKESLQQNTNQGQTMSTQATPMKKRPQGQVKTQSMYNGNLQSGNNSSKFMNTALTSDLQSPTDQKMGMSISSQNQNSIFRSPQALTSTHGQQTSKIQFRQREQSHEGEEYKVELTSPKMELQSPLSQVKSSDNLMIYPGMYQRKKDTEVQKLLDEFKQMKIDKEQQEIDSRKNCFMERGQSPTKRLIGNHPFKLIDNIELKRASHIHQPSMKEAKRNQHIEYSIRYVASPERSYLINPKEGEINYDLAYKNYDKFYDIVANQPIVKYKILEDQARKNENKGDKWFKTPNKVIVKETTRSQMKGGSGASYVGAVPQSRKNL